MKLNIKINWWLIAALALSLLVIFPIFRPGFWASDDGEWMVIRFSAFHESFRDGHFPVRWTQRLNRDFGYPVFNFLYPLPFYLAEIFHLLGFGFVSSIKAVFIISTLTAAVGMFLFAKKWGNSPAFLTTILFIFAPYRIFLLYDRGSLGESLALAFIPFIFLFMDELYKDQTWKNIFLFAVFYASLILSHNVVALLFTPLILLYLVLHQQKSSSKSFLKMALGGVVIGLALSAFFWIPAFWELQYTKASEVIISDYHSYFLNLRELVQMVGPIHIAAVFISLVYKKYFFSLVALLSILFIHPISKPIADWFPLVQKIQFPWRMATVAIFTSAAAAAQVVAKFNLGKYKAQSLAIVITVLSLLTIYPQITKIRYVDRQESYYSTNDDTTTVKDEFTPVWVREKPENRPGQRYQIKATPGTYEVIEEEFRTRKMYLQIRLDEPADVVFNTHYFPGWEVYVDDQKQSINPSETSGLLQIKVEPGRNNLRTIRAEFTKTPVRKLSELISFYSFLAMLFFLLIKTIGKKNKAKAVALLFLLLATVNLCYFIFANLKTYKQTFDPQLMEKKYLNSQWINPDFKKSVPIGDSGLYSWAGWSYIHGTNPILINPEMPPLGKYIIGLGILLTGRPAVVGLIFTLLALFTQFLLAKKLLGNVWLAVIATSLFSLEPLLLNLANVTMLDGLQLILLNLAFMAFIKGLEKKRWFWFTSLLLGGAAATKFFVSTAVVVFTFITYLIINKDWKKIRFFIISLPMIIFVHILSYAVYFQKGNNLRGYLGVQKWILDFYRQGNVGTIPPGSYWSLVLLNKWRIWFGQEWGIFSTIKTQVWRISWPLNVFVTLLSLLFFNKLKLSKEFSVIILWLVIYGIFLSFIIGWPHYMLLFLPYSYILLVELGRKYIPLIISSPLIKRLTAFVSKSTLR